MKKAIWFFVLFCVVGFANATISSTTKISISEADVSPRFIKPGSTVTLTLGITITMKPGEVSSQDWIYVGAVLSPVENEWGTTNKKMAIYDQSSGAEIKPYNGETISFRIPSRDLKQGFWRYSFNFIVPANFPTGEYFIVAKAAASQFSWNGTKKLKMSQLGGNNSKISTLSAPCEVTNIKDVVTNTVHVNKDRVAFADLVIIDDNRVSFLHLNNKVQDNTLDLAFGNKRTFSTVTQEVEIDLRDRGGNVLSNAEIYYSLNNQEPVIGTNKFTLPFDLTSGDTIRAIAYFPSGGDFEAPVEGFWVYEQILPTVFLRLNELKQDDILNLAVENKREFDKDVLPVTMDFCDSLGEPIIITGAQIYYTLGNKEVNLDGSDPDTKEYKLGEFFLTSSDTIRAVAVFPDGVNYQEAVEGFWVYDQNRPAGWITATPFEDKVNTGTHTFTTGSYKIYLETIEHDGAKIYYTVNGDDVVVGTATLYDGVTGIEITGTTTVKAIAYVPDHEVALGEWTYIQDLPNTELDLILLPNSKSAQHPVQVFGKTQDFTFKFSSGASLEYCLDCEDLDVAGIDYVVGDVVTIGNASPETLFDTVTVTARVFGENFKPSEKTWKFVRVNLPDPLVTPSGQPELKFTEDFKANITIPSVVVDFLLNPVIYYTMDGSVPSPDNPKSVSVPYSQPPISVSIDTTVVLKVVAYADNRLPSNVVIHEYRLVASGKAGWYYDFDANGSIDGAHIVLNKQVETVPSSIKFVSPFDAGTYADNGALIYDTLTIDKDRIDLVDDTLLLVSFGENAFPFTDETGFDPKELAVLFGAEYNDQASVLMEDSVAPVAVKGFYAPGNIIESLLPDVFRYRDTLIVTYSEAVAIADGEINPLKFLSPDGMTYTIPLEEIGEDRNQFEVTYLFVDTSITGQKIYEGDSLTIASGTTTDILGNEQVLEGGLWAPIDVKPLPYLLRVQAISPVNPAEYEVPLELLPSNGHSVPGNRLVIIADFLREIRGVEAGNLAASIVIFDQVGNVVAQASGFDGTGSVVIGRNESKLGDNAGMTSKIMFYWDGKNTRGRDVSSASYSALINIVGPDNQTHAVRISLGVVRSGTLAD